MFNEISWLTLILSLIPFLLFLNLFCFAVGYCEEVLWLLYHLYVKYNNKSNWNPSGVFEFISRAYGLLNIILIYWILWKYIKPLDIKLYFGLTVLFFGSGTISNIHNDNASFFSDSFHNISCLIALICSTLELGLYIFLNLLL